MINNILNNHLISQDESVRNALSKLNHLGADAILFVADDSKKLIGSLTDGDLRRGFINNLGFEDSLISFIKKNPVFVRLNSYNLEQIQAYKNEDYKIIPILDDENRIVDILNFRHQSTIIPAVAVLMAGGEGKRLMPLTKHTPKPLLKVGEKPIIEYNIDRLIKVGIKDIILSINYLGDQLVDYFGNGAKKNTNINYVRETEPLGTIGSVLLIKDFKFDDVIIMNSDLLTNIDFEDFYRTFKASGADMIIATTLYHVDVPYAVLEMDDTNEVKSLKEKPRYTYYSNAGIYIVKRELFELIPQNQFYDITDLIEDVLAKGKKMISYPITGYWLDIGRYEEYEKAQEDIKHIKF